MPSCTNGHHLSDRTAFCGVCGEDVRLRCSNGHMNTIGARFCPTCGGPVASTPGQGAVPARAPGAVPDSAPDAVARGATPLLLTPPPAGPAAPAGPPAGAEPPTPARGIPAGEPVTWHEPGPSGPSAPPAATVPRAATEPPLWRRATDTSFGPGVTENSFERNAPGLFSGPGGEAPPEERGVAETRGLPVDKPPALGPFLGRQDARDPFGETLGDGFFASPDAPARVSPRQPTWQSDIGQRVPGDDDGPGDPGDEPPDGPSSRRPHSRRIWFVAFGLGLLVIAAGGVMAVVLLHHHAPKPKPVAQSGHTHAPSSAPSSAPTSPNPSPSPAPSSSAIGPAGWTLAKPIDQQAYQNNNATIASISCVTAAKCFAVDSSGNILESTAGGNWRTVATDSQSNFVSISCASAHFCAAVDNSGEVVVLSSGVWSAPVSIDPDAGLTSVSCPTTAFCMAVDNSGYAFTFTGAVTNWSKSTLDPNQDTITSVYCDSATFCAAVDQSGNAYTYDGSSWNSAGDVDNGNELQQVSCFSSSFCGAVDNSGNAVLFAGGSWSAGTMPSTAASISCPASGYCVAVDTSGGALVYQQGSWSKASKIDGNNSFTTISCTGVNICTAADQYDNVLSYTSSAAG